MVRFYLKIQEKILVEYVFCIAIFIGLIFNIAIRLIPNLFIDFNAYKQVQLIVPKEVFIYCDVYITLIFIMILIISIGGDFENSMADITLAVGGQKYNKFILLKIYSVLLVYAVIYIFTYINIYTFFISFAKEWQSVLTIYEMIIQSIPTVFFVFSLSMSILFLTKDTTSSIIIVTSYYLIEEYLWNGRITKIRGILAHINFYSENTSLMMIYTKSIYFLLAIILCFIALKLSSRKFNFESTKYKFIKKR